MRSIKLPSWIERLLGLGARSVPPHVFALDERALRYGSFERREGQVELTEYGLRELPEDSFFDGPLGGPARDPDAFSEHLESLLQGAASRPSEACLVLPDRWLRLVFAEITELPSAPAARLEALRFKLRRLVPFRVEDLRVVGIEVASLADQVEPRRVLLSFAVQALLDQLERLFDAAGVRLGLIANQSVCAMAALPSQTNPAGTSSGAGATGLLLDATDGYTVLITVGGEPVLYRHKSLSPDLDRQLLGSIVGRDLQLTRSFLEERVGSFANGEVPEIWVAARQASVLSVPSDWAEWVRLGLGLEPRLLDAETLPELARLPRELEPIDGAPMLGAALQEVA